MASNETIAKLKLHLSKLVDKGTDLDESSPYWDLFWTLPASVGDITSVFSPATIKYIRDNNVTSFTSLILSVSNRLIYLSKLDRDPLDDFPTYQLLNCVRLLTLLLPALYEKKTLTHLEEEIFWNRFYHTPIYGDIRKAGGKSNGRNIANTGTKNLIDLDDENDSDDGICYANAVSANRQNRSDISTSSPGAQKTANIDGGNSAVKPIGAELLNTCLDLLFTPDFTIQRRPRSGQPTSNYTTNFNNLAWEPGFEVPGHYKDPKLMFDSNRLEILRLLLALFSRNLYCNISEISNAGSRFLTVFVAATDARKFYLLCLSLLNTILRSLKSNDTNSRDQYLNVESENNNGLEIPIEDHKKIRILMVTNALQLFNLMVAYSIPKQDFHFLFEYNISNTNGMTRNRTRIFLNKISNPKDIQLVLKTLTSPIVKPIIDSDLGAFSYIMKSSKLIEDDELHVWATELLILILELYQCNSRFRAYFAEISGAEYFIMLIYYILKFKNEKKHLAFTRLCIYNLLFLSSDLGLTAKLLTTFDSQLYDSLSQLLRTSTTPTSYRDFLVIHISNIIISDPSNSFILPNIQILHNLISMHVMILEYNKKEHRDVVLGNRRFSIKDLSKCAPNQISYAAATSILHVINRLSNSNYLSKDFETSSDYLALVLRSCCQSISRDPHGSVILMYVMSRNANLLVKLTCSIKKISDEAYTDLLLKERKEYDSNLQYQHFQSQQQIQNTPQQQQFQHNSTESNRASQDLYEYIEKSKESFEMPVLSRQTTQNTLESIPSIRSMPALTKQTSQISISNNSPKSMANVTVSDDSIDPISLGLNVNVNTNGNSNHSLQNNIEKTDDSKIIIPDVEIFKAEFPSGMTANDKGKQPYYERYENKWSGKDSLIFLKECVKVINNELSEQTNTEPAKPKQDATYMVQKMLKLNLDGMIAKIKGSESFVSEKITYQPLKLKWNSTTLGWYISLIWADIFTNYDSYAAKGILAEISSGISAIKKVSTSWGFGSWKLNSNADTGSSPLSNTSSVESSSKTSTDRYFDNILKNSIWFGTDIQLFRVNHLLLKEHYSLQTGNSDIFNPQYAHSNSSVGNVTSPVFAEVFWRKNSISSPLGGMRNGSGVFTEGFWKRQGGRPNSLDRRDSDGSLKLQLSRNPNK